MKTTNSKFPFKKCISASIVIIIVYVMILALLYGIIYSSKLTKYSAIFVYVWTGFLVLSLASYWIYQIIRYERNKKDERR